LHFLEHTLGTGAVLHEDTRSLQSSLAAILRMHHCWVQVKRLWYSLQRTTQSCALWRCGRVFGL